MVHGPQFNQNIHRIDPIDRDPSDQQDEKKRKKSFYLGRIWKETEEEKLPVQPPEQKTPPETEYGVYVDRLLLQRAKKFFSGLTTLEEKIAQLCFLSVDAIYDADLQHQAEMLIQLWQVGGIAFKKGDYRRQSFLISRFQEISKTPLLFANYFLHGLSFYLQGEPYKSDFSEVYFRDLGKAVTVQNRRLGVHIQFDQEDLGAKIAMSEKQAKAFRKGVREAQGIVGKQKTQRKPEPFSMLKKFMPFGLKEEGARFFSENSIQETIGYKLLTFFDTATFSDSEILNVYREHYDAFLVSQGNLQKIIQALAHLVRTGKISETELDRRVLKILIVKSLYFK